MVNLETNVSLYEVAANIQPNAHWELSFQKFTLTEYYYGLGHWSVDQSGRTFAWCGQTLEFYGRANLGIDGVALPQSTVGLHETEWTANSVLRGGVSPQPTLPSHAHSSFCSSGYRNQAESAADPGSLLSVDIRVKQACRIESRYM